MVNEIDVAHKLIDLVKKLDNQTSIFIGEILDVNLDNRTCTVK